MTRNTKLVLMFAPVLISLMAVGVITYDLKNPVSVDKDDCTVLATGAAVKPLKRSDNMLFNHGAGNFYDIGFQCEGRGVVFINDREIFQQSMVSPGNPATLKHKVYRYWPETWRINVRHSLSDPA